MFLDFIKVHLVLKSSRSSLIEARISLSSMIAFFQSVAGQKFMLLLLGSNQDQWFVKSKTAQLNEDLGLYFLFFHCCVYLIFS